MHLRSPSHLEVVREGRGVRGGERGSVSGVIVGVRRC